MNQSILKHAGEVTGIDPAIAVQVPGKFVLARQADGRVEETCQARRGETQVDRC